MILVASSYHRSVRWLCPQISSLAYPMLLEKCGTQPLCVEITCWCPDYPIREKKLLLIVYLYCSPLTVMAWLTSFLKKYVHFKHWLFEMIFWFWKWFFELKKKNVARIQPIFWESNFVHCKWTKQIE